MPIIFEIPSQFGKSAQLVPFLCLFVAADQLVHRAAQSSIAFEMFANGSLLVQRATDGLGRSSNGAVLGELVTNGTLGAQ